MVGLGTMGRPIAERIASRGFSVLAFDVDSRIEPTGVQRVAGLKEVAESDVVIVIVPSDHDVRDVVTGVGGLVANGHEGMVIVISSSVHPATCRELEVRAANADIRLVDAALTGGVRRAETGEMNLLIGGEYAVVESIRDVLLSFSQSYHLLGPVGAGQVAKAANNMIHWAEIAAINEAFQMAHRLGIDSVSLRKALTNGVTDSATLQEIHQMRFAWYKKDFDVAQQLAEEIGMDLPVAALSRLLMDEITVDSIAALFARCSA
jgi:3-hydroxyisobutyrate dehydrogenase-like beta-hydroxyacid dehydrogenase